MELKTGTKILYTSAAGTREATILEIKIGPTAKPGFLNTWLTLEIPIAKKLGAYTTVQIPGDNGSLKAFKVQLV